MARMTIDDRRPDAMQQNGPGEAAPNAHSSAHFIAHFCVRIDPAGITFSAPAASTLLHAAIAAGISLPVSCRNGTCRTCMCRATSGHVSYAIAWPGLSADEKREGYVLPCVAYPLSDIVLEQRAARRLRN